MKLFELVIEDEKVDEVFAISLVDNPAIEAMGYFFDKEQVQFREINKEQGLFIAPILIPNKRILRVDGKGETYEVFFSPETIKRLSQMYLEKKYTDSITEEHKTKVEGVNLVESWLVESVSKDKSSLYNLKAPIGSWVGTFKIDNEELREKFRKGELRAVSIEGMFEHMERPSELKLKQLFSKQIEDLDDAEAELFLETMKQLFESYSDYPDDVKNNAKRGIELNENQGNKCATQTGKVRAQQLANGEPISVDTIQRMYSYLSRAETYYDPNKTTECGTISYLLWGGKSALSWSRNKLRELGILEEGEQPQITSTYPGEVSSGSISKEMLQDTEIDIFGYETSHFFMCPGAVGTFKHLTEEMDLEGDLIDMARAAGVIADVVFMIENKVIEQKSASPRDLRRAEMLVDMFKDVFQTINERTNMEHDISYMDGHIEVIKSYLNGE